MLHYRAYAQPNDQPGERFFGLGSLDPGDTKYSKTLKAACKRGAGPRPPAPSFCPRCSTIGARFISVLCYKFGIAGAWNMVCSECQRVHLPKQWGPTETALDDIEAIRDREHKAREERAKQPKRARVTEPRAHTRRERGSAREVAPVYSQGSKRPLAAIGNDARLIKPEPGHAEYLSEDAKRDQNIPMSELPFCPEEHANSMPTIEVVIWSEDNKPPVVEHVPRPDDGKIYLAECDTARMRPGPNAWERFTFKSSLWSLLPFTTSRIDVKPNEDVIFIRFWNVRCRQFGEHLHRYQVSHASALARHISLRNTLNYPPLNHVWVIVWGMDQDVPETFLFDLRTVERATDDDIVILPWMHLLRAGQATSFAAWRAAHTSWQCFSGHTPFSEPGAPILLLAHPQAKGLIGSGEAIALLESWHTRAPGHSRSLIKAESLEGSSPHHISITGQRGTTSSEATRPIRTRSTEPADHLPNIISHPLSLRHLLGDHEPTDEKPRVGSNPLATVASARLPLLPTGSSTANCTLGDHEPTDEKPRVGSNGRATMLSPALPLLPTGSSAPNCGKQPPSDDEVEWVEDPRPASIRSRSQRKPRVRSNGRATMLSPALPFLPTGSSAPNCGKQPPSDDEVEWVEDTRPASIRSRSEQKPCVRSNDRAAMLSPALPLMPTGSSAPNRGKQPPSDDEVEWVEDTRPAPIRSRSEQKPRVDSNRGAAILSAPLSLLRTDHNLIEPDIVEIPRSVFWQGRAADRTLGGDSPANKTKRQRPPSWDANQAVSNASCPTRAHPSGSGDDCDAMHISPPKPKKPKTGSVATDPSTTPPPGLANHNVRVRDHAEHAPSSLTTSSPSRTHSLGRAATPFTPRRTTTIGFQRPEFIQGSSRTPLSGMDLETHDSNGGSLFVQGSSTSANRSPKKQRFDCNGGQDIIDLTEDSE